MGKTHRVAHATLDPGPQMAVLALDSLRMRFTDSTRAISTVDLYYPHTIGLYQGRLGKVCQPLITVGGQAIHEEDGQGGVSHHRLGRVLVQQAFPASV